MNDPKFRRRKSDRPDEIAEAAFEEFAERGFERARVDDVARRAGVSKGLLYVYFKTKEELFKAVIKRVMSVRIDALRRDIDRSQMSAEELLRGPMQTLMQRVPASPAKVVLKLLISEGSRHPDLLDYYWENVGSRGLALVRSIVRRGVESGEFRPSAIEDFPQVVISPMLMAAVWKLVFTDRKLDTDALIATHIDMLVRYLKVDPS